MDLGVIADLLGLFGLNAKEFTSIWAAKLREATQELGQARAISFLNNSKKSLADGLLRQLAHDLYPEFDSDFKNWQRFAFTMGDRRISTSVVSQPSWRSLQIELTDRSEHCVFLHRPLLQINPPSSKEIAEILERLRFRNARLWDAPTYRINSINVKRNSLIAEFCRDSYFRYRFTSGSLMDEMVDALSETDFNVSRCIQKKAELLPMRMRYVGTPDDIIKFNQRLCGASVSVTTAFAREEDYAIVLQRRSSEVATRQGALTVVPTGAHQPMVSFKGEANISRTAFRELYEELFGGDDSQHRSKHLEPDWFLSSSQPMRWLVRNPNCYKLMLTGVGISCVTGSCSFSLLLVINDKSFWKKFASRLTTNWEASDWELTDMKITDIDIPRQGEEYALGVEDEYAPDIWEQQGPVVSTKADIGMLLSRPEWTDHSLFSFVQGLHLLRKMYPNKVRPLPFK